MYSIVSRGILEKNGRSAFTTQRRRRREEMAELDRWTPDGAGESGTEGRWERSGDGGGSVVAGVLVGRSVLFGGFAVFGVVRREGVEG